MGTQLHHGKGHSIPHFSAHVYCGQTVVQLSYCCDLVGHSENQNGRISQQKDNAVSGATVALLWFWRRLKQVDFSAKLMSCNVAKCSPIFTTRRYASAVYAMDMCPSVIGLSDTSGCSIKTAKHITQIMHHDRSWILLFWCQTSWQNSTRSPQTRVPNAGGVR